MPLGQLAQLTLLDLAGNTDLQCPRPGLLDGVAQLTLPKHCLASEGSGP